ncbi:MAG: hypothetical protein H0V01_10655 [Bacteroidetes bacterium]|nr:hypothetical protein [Bacteroidota bacterium]HET6244812.1 hypothetical protein [Bacteroidia bacterium]
MSKKTPPPNPNWPSKIPGNPSGPDRGNNPAKTPAKPSPTPTPKKK